MSDPVNGWCMHCHDAPATHLVEGGWPVRPMSIPVCHRCYDACSTQVSPWTGTKGTQLGAMQSPADLPRGSESNPGATP